MWVILFRGIKIDAKGLPGVLWAAAVIPAG
jgi:hypothetical protein